MEKSRILILDCQGATRPAVCFCLEVAGFSNYVVTDQNEAVNLLCNALSIEKSFSCLLVNDYDPEKDQQPVLDAVERSGVGGKGCAVVFVHSRDAAKNFLAPLVEKFPQLQISTCRPAQAADLVTALLKSE